MSMHANQLAVTLTAVRGLVDLQFPEWAPLPITRVGSEGTVNAIFRIGDRIAARFPLLLVSDGRLAGIIDVGGLGPADPALDLVGAWHLLDAGPRQLLREDLRCDELEWARGKAWAFEQAMGAVWYYVESNPSMSRMGRRTLERITADGPAA